MASLIVNVEGDASGGVAALQSTSQALNGLNSTLGTTASTASSAGEETSRAFTLMERRGQGIRELASVTASLGPALAIAAGASTETAGAIGTLGSAFVMAAATANPLVQALIGISAVASVLSILGSDSEKAAAAVAMVSNSGQEMGQTFGSAAGSVGVSTNALIELAGAGLRSGGAMAGAGERSTQAASDIFEIVGASDAAGASTAKMASQAELLAASQDTMSSRLMASVGSFNAVAAAAGAAGESYAAYAARLGTQTVSPAPPELWQGRASGGRVSAGVPYIVGERGAELFVPGQAGAVMPSGTFAGGRGAGVLFAPQLNIGTVYGNNDLRSMVMSWMREATVYAAELRGHVGVN